MSEGVSELAELAVNMRQQLQCWLFFVLSLTIRGNPVKKQLLAILVGATFGVTGSAFAQTSNSATADQTGSNNTSSITQTEVSNNSASINQSGADNQATVLQTTAGWGQSGNTATITQSGNSSEAINLQTNSWYSTSSVTQEGGADNYAKNEANDADYSRQTLLQSGSGNGVTTFVVADHSTIDSQQFGDGNQAQITQFTAAWPTLTDTQDNLRINLYQNGTGNYANLEQTAGSDLGADAIQNGTGNAMYLIQKGTFNDAYTDQNGVNNYANVKQSMLGTASAKNSASVYQNGSGLVANITQH